MERKPRMIKMIGIIYTVTIIGGFSTFILAGGITGLASDVGTSGAWSLSFFIQFFYATLITTGFSAFVLLTHKVAALTSTSLSIVATSLLVAASINLYGIFRTGSGVEAILGSVIVIGGSAVLFFVVSLICNGLTRQSSATP